MGTWSTRWSCASSSTRRPFDTSIQSPTRSYCECSTKNTKTVPVLISPDRLNIFAHGLHKLGKPRTNAEDIFTALADVYGKCQGAYACTGMVAGFGIFGFRDANGIRPLCIGSRPSATLPGARDYFMASESVALKQLGFRDIVDVKPGEAVLIEKGGVVTFRQIVERRSYTPDCFEYVYFARPDSSIDGISVYRSRQKMGERLAGKIREVLGDKAVEEIDAGMLQPARPIVELF